MLVPQDIGDKPNAKELTVDRGKIIFHNICYGKPGATEQEVYAAAKLAHCDEFIHTLPGGYKAKVGERGTCS